MHRWAPFKIQELLQGSLQNAAMERLLYIRTGGTYQVIGVEILARQALLIPKSRTVSAWNMKLGDQRQPDRGAAEYNLALPSL